MVFKKTNMMPISVVMVFICQSDGDDDDADFSGDGVYMPAIRDCQTPCLSLTLHCFHTRLHTAKHCMMVLHTTHSTNCTLLTADLISTLHGN